MKNIACDLVFFFFASHWYRDGSCLFWALLCCCWIACTRSRNYVILYLTINSLSQHASQTNTSISMVYYVLIVLLLFIIGGANAAAPISRCLCDACCSCNFIRDSNQQFRFDWMWLWLWHTELLSQPWFMNHEMLSRNARDSSHWPKVGSFCVKANTIALSLFHTAQVHYTSRNLHKHAQRALQKMNSRLFVFVLPFFLNNISTECL